MNCILEIFPPGFMIVTCENNTSNKTDYVTFIDTNIKVMERRGTGIVRHKVMHKRTWHTQMHTHAC